MHEMTTIKKITFSQNGVWIKPLKKNTASWSRVLTRISVEASSEEEEEVNERREKAEENKTQDRVMGSFPPVVGSHSGSEERVGNRWEPRKRRKRWVVYICQCVNNAAFYLSLVVGIWMGFWGTLCELFICNLCVFLSLSPAVSFYHFPLLLIRMEN